MVSTTYCTAEDVRRTLQFRDKLTESTNPTKTEVEEMILEAESEIDLLTNASWKTTTVTEQFYNIPNLKYYNFSTGIPVYLKFRNIKELSSSDGDKLEVWNGSDYEDFLLTKTQGRSNDYWVDSRLGILYLKIWKPYFIDRAIRFTYRYGESSVPKDIRKATALLVSMEIIRNDDNSSIMDENGDVTRLSHSNRLDRMQEQFDRIVGNRTELHVI